MHNEEQPSGGAVYSNSKMLQGYIYWNEPHNYIVQKWCCSKYYSKLEFLLRGLNIKQTRRHVSGQSWTTGTVSKGFVTASLWKLGLGLVHWRCLMRTVEWCYKKVNRESRVQTDKLWVWHQSRWTYWMCICCSVVDPHYKGREGECPRGDR